MYSVGMSTKGATMTNTIATLYTGNLSADEKANEIASWEAKGFRGVRLTDVWNDSSSFAKCYRVTATHSIEVLEDIGSPTWDIQAGELAAAIEKDMDYKDVKVLDWTAPIADEDGWLISSVEIEYTP